MNKIIKQSICIFISLSVMFSIVCVKKISDVKALGQKYKIVETSSKKTKKKAKDNEIIKYNTIDSFYNDKTKVNFSYATTNNYKVYNFKKREKVNKYLKGKSFEDIYKNAVALKNSYEGFMGDSYLSRTIQQEDADYLYYGKLNKKSRPSGIGVLFNVPKSFSDFKEIPDVVYIGYFKNGNFNGYGAKFTTYEDSGWSIEVEYEQKNKFYFFVNDISYEGYFKNGKKSGKGNSFESNAYSLLANYTDYANDGELAEYDNSYDNNSDDYESDNSDSSSSYKPIYTDKQYEVMTRVLTENLSYKVSIGTFKNDQMNGKFKVYDNGKLLYSGGINQDGYCGNGKLYNQETGKLECEGEFSEGKLNGIGKLYNQETGKLEYEGEFINNVFNGKGTLYDENGNVIHKGNFYDGDIE